MKDNVAEKKLDLVLTAALCTDCGCWENGYTHHFVETLGSYTYSAWPDIQPDGDYDDANFEFMGAISAIGASRIDSMHYDYSFAVFTLRWVEPDRTIMTLNLFIDPPSEETYNMLLRVQHDALEHRMKQASEAMVQMMGAAAPGLVMEEEDCDCFSVTGNLSDHPAISETILCDVLTLAGYRATEGDLPTEVPEDIYEAFEWARAQVFGRPVSLVEEPPPYWVLELEKIVG